MQSKHLIPFLLLCASCGRPETVVVEEPAPVASLPPVEIPAAAPTPTFTPEDDSPKSTAPEASPTPSPSVTPTPTPSPSDAPAPVPLHVDQYQGSYPATTLRLSLDKCDGSCGLTWNFPAVTVEGTASTTYYANGVLAEETIQWNWLIWSSTQDPHISTCPGSVETDTWGITPHGGNQQFKREIVGGCQGGIEYDCVCEYISN